MVVDMVPVARHMAIVVLDTVVVQQQAPAEITDVQQDNAVLNTDSKQIKRD